MKPPHGGAEKTCREGRFPWFSEVARLTRFHVEPERQRVRFAKRRENTGARAQR